MLRILAHHGSVWFLLIISGLALIAVAVLVAVGVIPVFTAALTFAAITGVGAALALIVALTARPQPIPPAVRLLGSRATVLQALAPQGRVLVQGENWAASLDAPFVGQSIPVGQAVRVLAVIDLRLIVAPEPSAPLGVPTHS